MLKRNNQRGFTLIELLVVIAIISLLSSVIFSKVSISRERARIASGQQFESQVSHGSGDELQGAWLLNEKTGSVAMDSSGYGNNGTIAGPLNWSTDSPTNSSDGSLLFNGTTNFLTIPHSIRYKPSNAVSMGAWIKVNDFTYANQKVFSIKDSGGYVLGFDDNYCPAWSFCAIVYVGSYQYAYIPRTIFKVGKWYHVFMTYDSETINLYVDGKRVATNATPSGPITYHATNQTPLCIGNEANSADCAANEQLFGNVANARIYSKALTATNINSIYALEAPKFKTASK